MTAELEREAARRERELERMVGRSPDRVEESIPFAGEFVFGAEEPDQGRSAGILDDILHRGDGTVLEELAAVPGRVAQVQDHVADRVVVELGEIPRQFETPPADDPRPLEGQEALIAEVQL